MVFPGAPERCNGTDDDCDLDTDEEPDASASCATACTSTAACVSGACITTPLVCDDANPCTQDSCDLGSGCQFTPQPNGLSCSDGNPCTGEETCHNGECGNAPDLVCDDGNACTLDLCSPPNGCRNTPVPGCCTTDADCADASACTTAERCVAGACLSDPVSCDDHEPCTTDSCDVALGCHNIPVVNGIACGDGDVCNGIETCQAGACSNGTPPACNDGNPCTIDGCDALAGCTVQEVPGCCDSDADCRDASACTVNERCTAHSCVSDPLPCDDGNPCTSDGCNAASGCTFTPLPNGQSCGNLDFCDGYETCQAGSCVPGTAPLCDDGNPCTSDSCDSQSGCTHTAVPGCCFTNADCTDASACTIDERCVGGSCTSSPRNCNDGNPCTADSCNPSAGCLNVALLDGTSCSDGQACDGLETCASGTCRAGTPPSCDDHNFCTTDSCDNVTGCRHVPVGACCNSDSDCTDADQCTIGEHCLVSHTCASQALGCSDGNPCTTDGCNPASGCVHAPTSGPCNDGLACTTGDACNAGQCAGTPVDCNDGNFCDGTETCAPESGACVSGSELTCIPGGRNPAIECVGEWYVEAPLPAAADLLRVRAIDCIQGDAACDHDDASETCTFRLAVCLALDDSRLPGCSANPVTNYVLPRSMLRKATLAATALVSAVASLPGASFDNTSSNSVTFSPPIASPQCTGLVSLPVGVGRRLTLKARLLTAGGRSDTDRIKLNCR